MTDMANNSYQFCPTNFYDADNNQMRDVVVTMTPVCRASGEHVEDSK